MDEGTVFISVKVLIIKVNEAAMHMCRPCSVLVRKRCKFIRKSLEKSGVSGVMSE